MKLKNRIAYIRIYFEIVLNILSTLFKKTIAKYYSLPKIGYLKYPMQYHDSFDDLKKSATIKGGKMRRNCTYK